ncbi:MAG: XdhC family protein [Alkaliphilus sp.]
MRIYSEIAKLEEKNISFAVATIISAKGSTPRTSAKMIIKNDASIIGTVGGGVVESYVVEQAIEAINENNSRVVEYALNKEAKEGIHMDCGGDMTFFIEVISSSPEIVIIGAGHVGSAVYKQACLLNYDTVIVDNSKEYVHEQRFPKAKFIYVDESIQVAINNVKVDDNTFIVIVTRDCDEQALETVIDSQAAYIGMIGSVRKTAKIMNSMRDKGKAEVKIDFVYAPIGLDIGAETPEEIAVSIMAEIMKVKSGKTGLLLKEIKKHG